MSNLTYGIKILFFLSFLFGILRNKNNTQNNYTDNEENYFHTTLK